MQIRVQGQQVQLIRSPYDSTKKRCVQKVVHTFPKHEHYLSADPIDYLSADQNLDLSYDERSALRDWLNERVKQHQADKREEAIRLAATNMMQTSEAILADGIDAATAQSIYEAMDILKSALRKSGHKKSKPAVADNQ